MNSLNKNIYFISDTHFNQWFANWFFNRQFRDIKEMNTMIIENWNKAVGDDDIIVIVGDFYSGNREFLEELIDKLNGEKILVKGNHDFWFRYRKLIRDGRIEVYNKLEINVKDINILVSHIPYAILPKNTLNIHGHYHRKLRPIELRDKYYYNVCVDHTDFKPVALKTILAHYYNTEEWYEPITEFIEVLANRRKLNSQYMLT